MSSFNLNFIMSEGKNGAAKSKVFCAFHPENKKIANTVMKDIISACDCTVFYYENGGSTEANIGFEDDLAEMNLFVIVVSSEYLFTDSFARNVIYKFALDNMIPILPIMIENGLEQPFNDTMGTLQYLLLNNEQYDVTSIPYSEKLKSYLSRVLSDSEEKKRLRRAFDASLFLSYRKKDRKYAQELMQLIHSDERCRGISIWYDEFLVPGENFNTEIKDELESSTAVILVVTPHIAEEGNYIILTEYPMALSFGKTVIPFEMSPTKKAELDSLYSALPDIIPTEDANTVRTAILDSIDKLGIKALESSAEREYLRGLAYLKGICVEKNMEIGAKKVLTAAENGIPEAIETAVFMYRHGEGVNLSLKDAALWQEKYINIEQELYENNKTTENTEALARAYFELSEIYEQGIDFSAAIDVYEKIIELCSQEELSTESTFEEFCIGASIKCGVLYMTLGKHFNARYPHLNFALEKRKEQQERNSTLLARVMVCEIYTLLAECCEMCQDRIGAKELVLKFKKMLPSPEDINEIASEDYTLVERILSCNNKLGHFYVNYFEDKSNEALICIGNSVLIAKKLIKISDCYSARRQLVAAHINDGDQHANKRVENHLLAAESAYNNASATAQFIKEKYDLTFELRRDLARILQKQAFVKKELKDTETAIDMYNEAIVGLRNINGLVDSLISRKDLYDCIRDTASACEAAGNTEKAVELLLESIALAKKNVAESELAVYKKDEAAAHKLVAEIYKKQWEMDEAFAHAQARCDLLRKVMLGTKRMGDMKLFVNTILETLPIAKLAGEFATVKKLQAELKEIYEENKIFFD